MKQIAIIGAGPAGSIAAILLARAGLRVTLIEQHRFPRDKVCGECLSAVAIDVLSRNKLVEPIRALRPVILTRSLMFACDGSCAEVELPSPMWGISRRAMDERLLALAKEAGASLFQPARCERIDSDPDRPIVTIRDLQTNQISGLEVDCVLVADGKAGMMPGSITPTDDFGLKAHFTGIDAPHDAIELFGVHHHYGGIAPIEGGRWNIAFSVPGSRIKAHAVTRASSSCDVHPHGRDARVTTERSDHFDDLFRDVCDENLALKSQLRSARRTSDWLISPLPRFAVSHTWPANVIPLGNAAAALEPIGGEGMGLAMRSAELAVNEIIAATQSNRAISTRRLQLSYRKLWNMRRFACRTGAKLISSPTLSRWGISLASHISGPADLALRLVGK